MKNKIFCNFGFHKTKSTKYLIIPSDNSLLGYWQTEKKCLNCLKLNVSQEKFFIHKKSAEEIKFRTENFIK